MPMPAPAPTHPHAAAAAGDAEHDVGASLHAWPGLDVEELVGSAVAVTQETALQGAGGHADTELWNPSLFWEPPPIRFVILRQPAAAARGGGTGDDGR